MRISPSLLHLGGVSTAALHDVRQRADAVRRGYRPQVGQVAPIALLLADPSPYVRAAVEAGAAIVGARVTTYSPAEVSVLGEPAVAGERLGRLHSCIVGVGMAAGQLAALAERSSAPVLNGGDANGDPIGAIADLATLEGALGRLDGKKLAWVGDTSGLLHDLLVAGCACGLSVAVAHPVGFAPGSERLTWARDRAAVAGGYVLVTTELAEAVVDADAIYVEPWPISAVDRFRPYAIQRHTVRQARAGVVVLHRFPERRGLELSGSFTEEPTWLAPNQSRARADSAAALLWSLLQADPLRSVLR